MGVFRKSSISLLSAISVWKISDLLLLDSDLWDLPFIAKLNLKKMPYCATDEVLDDTIGILIDNGWSAASPEVTKIRFYAAHRCMQTGNAACMHKWLQTLKHVPHVGEGYAQEIARKSIIKELEMKLLADKGFYEKRSNE